MSERFKNAIRYVFFYLTEWGICDAEIHVTGGTLRYRFYNWLYGDGEPEFFTILPDDERRD